MKESRKVVAMSKKHLVLVMRCVLLASLCFSCYCFAETEMTWFDANELRVDGRGWENTPTPYCRLPETVKDDVPTDVWDISKQSAGLIVYFNTNSSDISFQWTLTGGLAMQHMPATGVSGLDLYQRSDEGAWYFVHNGRPMASKNKTAAVISNPESNIREYKLYLPLYNGIKSLQFGVSKGASFSQPPASKKKPIVYYGTSIAQGGCASRPGMAFTAMLDRMLDRPIINLGFSGSGKKSFISSMASSFVCRLTSLPAIFTDVKSKKPRSDSLEKWKERLKFLACWRAKGVDSSLKALG